MFDERKVADGAGRRVIKYNIGDGKMKEMPVIDRGKCQGCGLCVSVCACGALKIVENTVTVIKVDECRWCTLCELVCPHGAISCPFEIIIETDQI